jgi:translation initiation factor IF-2
MTGAKMRVYEIAREVGLPNKELISKIRALGLEVNNHMSSLDADDVARVKRSLEKERLANTETKRLSSTVLRRRSKRKRTPKEDGEGTQVKQAEAEPTEAKPKVRKKVAVQAAPVPEVQRAKAEAKEPKKKAEPAAETPEAAAKPVRRKAKKAEVKAEAPAAPEPKAEEVEKAAAEPAPAKPEPVEAKPEPTKAKKTKAKAKKAAKVEEAEKVEKTAKAKEPEKAEAKVEAKSEELVETKPEPKKPAKAARARNRFEEELARARARVSAREAEEKAKKEAEKEKVEEDRDPSKPAVGSIINLPVPRIKITPAPSRQNVPGQRQIRGRWDGGRGGRGRGRRNYGRKGQQARKGGGKQTQITTPAEHKRVIRMEDTIAIPELAKGMGIKANEVLRKLWQQGMVGININAQIDFDTAQIIAGEFGYEVQNVAFKEEEVFVSAPDTEEELEPRAPVVTVMGHVDHGKTSLLDAIRNTAVTKGEAGGITQHIAAYRVNAGKDYGDIVFLDTPGHAAFTEMRARGGQTADIVVLVVAADDGVMPQTQEAVNHAKDAEVQIIVAINKCDLPNAQPERVKQQLGEFGLIPEEWGGETQYVEVSALKGEGIENLLEAISLNAELLELKANPDKSAQGTIVEAKLDRNRGPMATVLIEEGTLHTGDIVVAGEYYGKVRAMLNDKGSVVKEAGPATPVELLGLDGVPLAGETLNVADDEKVAKQVVEHRRQAKRKKELATTGRFSLESIKEMISAGDTKELKIVLKADVQGSAEALKKELEKQATEKVNVNVIQAGVGGITETDVNLARAGGAIIVGFHVRPAGKSAKLAEREGVEIKLYDVIYEAIDDVRAAMAGLLPPVRRKQDQGKAEVRDTFTIPRRGVVAGCMITDGKIYRKSHVRVIRDSVQIHDGQIGSLRRFKDDVAEVASGYECGIMVDNFNDIQIGDILEAYEIIEEAATLD